ncbi:MAG TPA: ASCH domain-containing protein [Myxococcaceae bacterium]|nr:ASCH domain-containing protein [Myxococcaceae bacterium]
MKALSLTQPWATLVAKGAKRIETRSWRTSHRGRIAIHASMGFPRGAQALCLEDPFHLELFGQRAAAADRLVSAARLTELPRGAVVATARLICCEPTGDVIVAVDMMDRHGAPFEEAFGDYSPGRWMWFLEDVAPLADPVPARGALSLWEWTPPEGWRP